MSACEAEGDGSIRGSEGLQSGNDVDRRVVDGVDRYGDRGLTVNAVAVNGEISERLRAGEIGGGSIGHRLAGGADRDCAA